MRNETGALLRVALVGMMGSGKSSVGRELARRLSLGFVDTDVAIERQAGCTIAEIFAGAGEIKFRALESEQIARLESLGATVVAVGGGAFVGDRNVARIRAACYTIYLRALPETLRRRLAGAAADARPLLGVGDAGARLAALTEVRAPWYRRAHDTIDVDTRTIEQVVTAIVERLRGAGRCG